MACIFLISDPHFGQASMLNFKKADGTPLRPFATVEEMDETMASNWNSVVRPQDKIYCLGDVVMKKQQLDILKRLNGHKRLVRGNHDIFETKEYMKYFEDIYGVRVLDDMILSHIPLHPNSITKRYNTNVHGHLHSGFVADKDGLPDGRYFSVCVEKINFTPISLEDLRIRIKEQKEKYPPIYATDMKGPD